MEQWRSYVPNCIYKGDFRIFKAHILHHQSQCELCTRFAMQQDKAATYRSEHCFSPASEIHHPVNLQVQFTTSLPQLLIRFLAKCPHPHSRAGKRIGVFQDLMRLKLPLEVLQGYCAAQDQHCLAEGMADSWRHHCLILQQQDTSRDTAQNHKAAFYCSGILQRPQSKCKLYLQAIHTFFTM